MGKRTTFTQAEVVRAVKAAQLCGLKITSTRITADGDIVIYHDDHSAVELTPFEKWKAEQDARETEGP